MTSWLREPGRPSRQLPNKEFYSPDRMRGGGPVAVGTGHEAGPAVELRVVRCPACARGSEGCMDRDDTPDGSRQERDDRVRALLAESERYSSSDVDSVRHRQASAGFFVLALGVAGPAAVVGGVQPALSFVLTVVALLAVGLSVALVRCPRCRRRSFFKDGDVRLFTVRCSHCELDYWDPAT